MSKEFNLRYLIVGLGNIGAKRAGLLGEAVSGTVDPVNPEADHRDLSEVDPKSFDAAVLAVPEEAKPGLAGELLARGKHVLLEKPFLFESETQFRELQKASEKTGAIWSTAYNHRFEPLIVKFREVLDQDRLGPLYHAHLVYGNGTAQNWKDTWRESGYGVLTDLGCHLIDLTEYLFGYREPEFILYDARRIETRVFDRCLFATQDRRITMECGTTMWRNRFGIEAYGEKGSVHLTGLCKWGPSRLEVHERVWPSGRPGEKIEECFLEDNSFGADLIEFERRVTAGESSAEADLRIWTALEGLFAQARERGDEIHDR